MPEMFCGENIKKATMAKRENITKTGKGGMGKYTEVDELVLDILGKGISPYLWPWSNIHHVLVDVNEGPEIIDDCPEPVPHQSSQA
ncbi:hypothetical protein Avbf_08543 [Armadillidium vulgare]|nr:hypothetical protein Avbf_08543 [Armadillidium vulgare]